MVTDWTCTEAVGTTWEDIFSPGTDWTCTGNSEGAFQFGAFQADAFQVDVDDTTQWLCS